MAAGHLADFVFAELYAHLIGCLAPKSERQIIIRSFTAACCDDITDRLLALVERSRAARTSNGRELVVIKDAAIKAFMKEHDIRLRSCCVGSPSNVNEAAQAAGRAAGETGRHSVGPGVVLPVFSAFLPAPSSSAYR